MASANKHRRNILDRFAAFLRRPVPVLDANDPPTEPQSINLEPHIRHEDGEPDSLLPQVVIDGTVLTAFDYGPIDLSEFERSLAADGTYFIWTCTCGVPGCGGHFNGVRVKHANGVVHWHDLDTRDRYCFLLADLFTAFETLQRAARQLVANQPALSITPDQNIPYFRGRPGS